MSSVDCKVLVDSYLSWLRDSSTTRSAEGVCEITTPFLDRHNDHLQIYVRHDGENFILTDDGYILSDLEQSGFELTTERRKTIFHNVLNGFGVNLSPENELQVVARKQNFAQKKHSLIQAMLTINDLFVLARETVSSVFLEDVERFLQENKVRYTSRLKLPGKSSFDHTIDFVIPRSTQKPERLLRVVNRADREQVTSVIFAFSDVRALRPTPADTYLFFNDEVHSLSTEAASALDAYRVKAIAWTSRNQYVEELVT